MQEQHQPNASSEALCVKELPPDIGLLNSHRLHNATEAGSSSLFLPGDQVSGTKQHSKVLPVNKPHMQILKEMRMRALNSDFESGV